MQIIEKFISINGEGLRQGELALFIRFKDCNLRCSYCDTKYSFENPKYNEEDIPSLIKYAKDNNIKNITLTGGEPLIQKDINLLMKKKINNNFHVKIETNEYININNFINDDNISYTLDYKLPTSLMEKFMDVDNYNYINKKDSVKFVCGNIDDLNKMKLNINKYDLINKTNVIISPVFNMIKPEDIVNYLIDNNLNGIRMQLQIHKFIWDPNKRGV